jgi:hypothetical protein
MAFEKTECDIEIFHDARQKFEKCKNKDIFYGIAYCRQYHYTIEQSMDMLHHCASCLSNTDEPTTVKGKVRSI